MNEICFLYSLHVCKMSRVAMENYSNLLILVQSIILMNLVYKDKVSFNYLLKLIYLLIIKLIIILNTKFNFLNAKNFGIAKSLSLLVLYLITKKSIYKLIPFFFLHLSFSRLIKNSLN